MKNKNKAEVINLTTKELERLKARVSKNELGEDDIKILSSILSVYFWIHNQLQLSKLNVRRLKNMFGFKTEKKPGMQPLEIEPRNLIVPPDGISLSAAETTIEVSENPKQKK